MSRLIALLIISLSAISEGSFYGPLLTKETDSGLVPSHLWTAIRCEIYPDKLRETITAGAVTVTREASLKITTAGLSKAIDTAALGPITEEPAPTDGPANIYFATQVLPDDRTKQVDLGSYVSGLFTKNGSKVALTLKNLLNLHCK